MRSIEQRIHASIKNGKGIRLTAKELRDFVWCDDAIIMRISNRASVEGGNEEPLSASVEIFGMTWKELMNEKETPNAE